MGSLSGGILGWQTVQSGNGMVFFYFLQNWDTCRLLELYVKNSRKSNKKRQKMALTTFSFCVKILFASEQYVRSIVSGERGGCEWKKIVGSGLLSCPTRLESA